ncbi:hypothetical protein [Nodosilinea sp. E11]|uniref:hypothetical protein n=1 Tax=Nodosilinea sp. E11 TaxID=3037479 RepID=UPI0029349941|nr:hypothetical protein [Nodosilinea sp. E11]WOD40223.1 hypothetical protein RRF56_05390 [Nodosilinea sp. E11]
MKTLRKQRSTLGFKGGAVALALSAFAITACQTPNDTAGTTDTQPTTQQPATDQQATDPDDANIQVGDLAGNLEDYLGQSVSVRGDVVEAVGQNALILRGDGLFGGDDVVVFNATGEPIVLTEAGATERLQVTGEVRQVVIGEIAQQYGLTLDEATYGDYENQPAIIAESVALAPEPGEISDNPEAFYNRVIAVEGEVGEQYDNNTFTISGAGLFGGSDVLVVGDQANMANLGDDFEVVILGTLRPFNAAELEREYNLTWDDNLRQSIESDYGDESILVAEQVFPLGR